LPDSLLFQSHTFVWHHSNIRTFKPYVLWQKSWIAIKSLTSNSSLIHDEQNSDVFRH